MTQFHETCDQFIYLFIGVFRKTWAPNDFIDSRWFLLISSKVHHFWKNCSWKSPRWMGYPSNMLIYGCFLKWWYRTPKSSQFNRVFHYKPLHFGVPLFFWKHPYMLYQCDSQWYHHVVLGLRMPYESPRTRSCSERVSSTLVATVVVVRLTTHGPKGSEQWAGIKNPGWLGYMMDHNTSTNK